MVFGFFYIPFLLYRIETQAFIKSPRRVIECFPAIAEDLSIYIGYSKSSIHKFDLFDLSIYLFIYLPIYLSIHICIYIHVYTYIYMYIYV